MDEATKDNREPTCSMDTTDEQGRSNLCCCYIMDPDGTIHDPCYYPADECC